ncbi:MAG: hypothetical protein P8K77_05455 [Polaribacter sp.]|nr:hypothetical protein [Polaribacter sp.]
MTKNKNLINNHSFNFRLKGTASILIGIYMLLGATLIKAVLTGFITDNSPLGFLSIENIEVFIGLIIVFIFFFSLLAIFFGSRRTARKLGYNVWNKLSKKSCWLLLSLFFLVYLIGHLLLENGYFNYIVPAFLICYGFLLSALNYNKYTGLYVLTIGSLLLGIFSLFIPAYWQYSLISLGLAHIAFGTLVKN